LTVPIVGSIRVRSERGVAVVTIDRPPANAIDLILVAELLAALTDAAAAHGIGAVVLTGSGRMFVSGADIGILSELQLEAYSHYVRRVQEAFDKVEELPIPLVAAIGGHAVGGGLELALACDLRFASSRAKLGLPEVKLGLLPGAGGTQRLSRLVGNGRALDLLYTGRILTAKQALQLGIVEYVTSPETLLAKAIDYAAALAVGPRGALEAIKRAVFSGSHSGIRAGLASELSSSTHLFQTDDAREGIAAFLEKRSPRFGRPILEAAE
jgi:enoyl-CoA hydratase